VTELPRVAGPAGRPRAGPALSVSLDFDGTLVEENVAMRLLEEFVPGGREVAERIDARLTAGLMTLREAWAEEVALLPVDRMEEMATFSVRSTHLRRGAADLCHRLRQAGIPAIVLSGGLDFYIAPILENAGIELPVFSDKVLVGPDGRLRVVHPHAHATCTLCGICKAHAVRSSSSPSGAERTIFVGDGSTDRYAAEVADIIFARHRLRAYCERFGILHEPFEEFGPVTERILDWHEGRRALPPARSVGRGESPCLLSRELADPLGDLVA
jgi:2-hydroxy-3-keto-5-methylthiopentenyl-1-phosphate phosphatase